MQTANLLLQETVADLNRQVPEEIPLNRFRPNIIVAGGEPWAEDRWQVCAGTEETALTLTLTWTLASEAMDHLQAGSDLTRRFLKLTV